MRFRAILVMALLASAGEMAGDGPPPSRGVEPKAAPLAIVPFRWTPGQIEVEVSVNGRTPTWFIVDTGAEYSILDEPLARGLGLATSERFGRPFARGVSLRLGGIEMRNQDVMVLPLENFHSQRRPIVGVIGADLFRHYVVCIDYAARTLALREPGRPRANVPAASIPITFAGRLATVPITVTLDDSTTFQASVTLDTGVSQTLILRHPFAETHGLLQRAAAYPTTRAGSLETKSVTFAKLPAKALRIGPFSFRDPMLRLYTSASGAGGDMATDGALGNEILRRFTVTFDYARKRLELEPNASIHEPLP